VISKAVHEDCKRKHKKLSIAWIDYQKAFDSVPNSWVEKSTEVIGAKSKMFRFCKLSMEKWKTRLHFKTNQEVIESQPIQVQRAYSGGFLSPLFFCIKLIPLRNI
jgi:hypothetical protein